MAKFFEARVGAKRPAKNLTIADALLQGAEECLRAAKYLDKGDRPDETGEYILLFHAIELALKAYLLKRGITEKHLKNVLGHDLKGLLKEAVKAGLVLTVKNGEQLVAWISDWHSNQVKIRYDFKNERFLPLCNAVFPLSEEIIKNAKA